MKALIGIFAVSAICSAALIPAGSGEFQATGLGTVPTVLTIQARGSGDVAYGCVAYISGADVQGGDACAGGVPTSTQFTQQGQTQTQLISSAINLEGYSGGITDFSNLAIVANFNQRGQAVPIQLDALTLTLTSGDLRWDSGDLSCDAPCEFTPLSPGTGSAGYIFRLDDTQAADAAAYFSSVNLSTVRVGLSASVNNSVGGLESFFLGAVPLQDDPNEPIPEPTTVLLVGAGLAGAVLYRRRQA